MSLILALDLGTQTGWAVGGKKVPKKIVASGFKSLQAQKHQHPGLRFYRFAKLLNELADEYNIEQIYYEHVNAHLGKKAAQVYGGMLGVLYVFCAQQALPCFPFFPSDIKSFITGKSDADKASVINSLREQNIFISDNNEADAAALLLLAASGAAPRKLDERETLNFDSVDIEPQPKPRTKTKAIPKPRKKKLVISDSSDVIYSVPFSIFNSITDLD